MKMRIDWEMVEKFHRKLDELDEDEVYVLLLIKDKPADRLIVDSMSVKSNDFSEFKRKVVNIVRKIDNPLKYLVSIDVNKKSIIDGFNMANEIIREKYRRNEPVKNFTQILMNSIRKCNSSETFTVHIENRKLPHSKFAVKFKNSIYNVVKGESLYCEIPLPGVMSFGDYPELL